MQLRTSSNNVQRIGSIRAIARQPVSKVAFDRSLPSQHTHTHIYTPGNLSPHPPVRVPPQRFRKVDSGRARVCVYTRLCVACVCVCIGMWSARWLIVGGATVHHHYHWSPLPPPVHHDHYRCARYFVRARVCVCACVFETAVSKSMFARGTCPIVGDWKKTLSKTNGSRDLFSTTTTDDSGVITFSGRPSRALATFRRSRAYRNRRRRRRERQQSIRTARAAHGPLTAARITTPPPTRRYCSLIRPYARRAPRHSDSRGFTTLRLLRLLLGRGRLQRNLRTTCPFFGRNRHVSRSAVCSCAGTCSCGACVRVGFTVFLRVFNIICVAESNNVRA